MPAEITPPRAQSRWSLFTTKTDRDHPKSLFAARSQASPKFQINIATFHDPDFYVLRNLNTTIFPVLWINQTATMDEGTRTLIYERIYLTRNIAYIAVYAIGALGVALGIGALVACFVCGTRRVSSVASLPVEEFPFRH